MEYATAYSGKKVHQIKWLYLFQLLSRIELIFNLEKFRNFIRKISNLFGMVNLEFGFRGNSSEHC